MIKIMMAIYDKVNAVEIMIMIFLLEMMMVDTCMYVQVCMDNYDPLTFCLKKLSFTESTVTLDNEL